MVQQIISFIKDIVPSIMHECPFMVIEFSFEKQKSLSETSFVKTSTLISVFPSDYKLMFFVSNVLQESNVLV